MRALLLALLGCTLLSSAKEYLYPVATNPQEKSVYIIYQKSPSHIELWEWDPESKYAQQLLLSRYCPAGFKILPDYSGFSFIDHGNLIVKQFLKRSPKRIEFDAPITGVEIVQWFSNTHCCTSAVYDDYSGIFQIDWQGCVRPVLYQAGQDFLYPQKIDNDLFFIQRNEQGDHIIGKSKYSVSGEQTEFLQALESYESGPGTEKIIDFGRKPIAFLKMLTPKEGYVLSYQEVVSKNSQNVTFECYYFWDEGDWKHKKIFSFNVPTTLLLPGLDRLYESVLPFLPIACARDIYFVDCSPRPILYKYSLDTKDQIKCKSRQGQLVGIVPFGQGILFGGEIGDEIDMAEGVYMDLGIHVDS